MEIILNNTPLDIYYSFCDKVSEGAIKGLDFTAWNENENVTNGLSQQDIKSIEAACMKDLAK